ncbi:MAG TPA: Xaa-Pro peptidase family protein [Thermomicrobiales bacterium]|nr:Xaa-Pro peptidase family protein [Thermomicrobiales bacterium]
MLLNLERARAVMAERNLDALVAASPENVTYASGFANWTLYTFKDIEMYVVIPRDGELSLIAAIDASEYLAQCPVAPSRLYLYGTFHIERRPGAALAGAEAALVAIRGGAIRQPNAATALRQALDDSGLSGSRIGLDDRGITLSRWRATQEALDNVVVEEAGDLFRRVRLIKTEPEIERLRYVVRVVEQGMLAAFEAATPGITEWDLEAVFRTTVAAGGAIPGHFETSAGTRSAGCFPSSAEYRITQGDVIRSDAGGRYLGYWADTGRTAVLGQPPADLRRYYDALRRGIDAICTQIKPGVSVGTLFETGVQTVREAGIPHYQRHHVGHSIGLEFYEPPILVGQGGSNDIHRSSGADVFLEENMVVNVELPYYELGLGGLQIEDTLVVRAGGYERLNTADHELRIYRD